MDGLTGGSAVAATANSPARHAPLDDQEQSWEAVLAALEADLRATERTMRAPVAVSDAVLDESAAAPARTSLPRALDPSGALPTMPAMPPAHAMPPISPEVEARIRELRTRIVALQLQLRDELAMLQGSMTMRPRPIVAVESAPQFFDSRV